MKNIESVGVRVSGRRGRIDFFLSLLARAAGAPVALVATMMLAHLLGPLKFGTYMTLLSGALVAGTFSSFGLGPLLTREVASLREVGRSTSPVIIWALRLTSILALVSGLIVLGWLNFGHLAPPANWGGRIATTLIIPVFAISILLAGILAGYGRVALSQALGSVWKNFFLLLFVLMLFVTGIDSTALALWAQAVSFALISIIGLFQIWRIEAPKIQRLKDVWLAPLPASRVQFLRRSAGHFLAMSLALLLMWRLDVVIVNAISGPRQAGIFGIAARLSQVPCLAGFVWIVWLRPRFSAFLSVNDRDGVDSLLKVALRGGAVMTVALGVASWILAPTIMRLIGTEFVAAVQPFRWLVLANIVWGISVPFNAYLSMAGYERYLARIFWGQLLVALLAGVPLIVYAGALGASWAWGAAVAAGSLAMSALGFFKWRRK